MTSQEYVAYFEDSDTGLLENTSATKQFIVPMGSTMRLRVRMGSKFSENPVLLVNLPEKTSPGEESKETTLTAPQVTTTGSAASGGSGETQAQPVKTLNSALGQQQEAKLVASPISKNTSSTQYTMTQPINEDGTRLEMGSGWSLSTTYLKRQLPDRLQTGQRPPSQTYYEFTVDFADAGSFFVQLEYGKRQAGAESLRYTKPSYINVEPVLSLSRAGNGGPTLKCKELSICTVVSRCLGPIDRWSKVLAPLSEQAYNAIHFTPIQVYGESLSHYSIADQTDFSDYFFSPSVGEESKVGISKQEKFAKVQEAMDSFRSDLGLFGIVDIVLNHTANNSAWIQDHPEACYNTDDVPRLWPAYLLDAELNKLSAEYGAGRVPGCPSAPYLNNEQDLNQVIAEMTRRSQALQLHEFFLCTFDRNTFLGSLPGLSQAIVTAKIAEFTKEKLFTQDPFKVLQEHFIDKLAHGPERRQVSLKLPDAAIFFVHLNQQNVTRAIEQVEELVNRSNEYWTVTVDQWLAEAMQNCCGTMRYFKIQLGRNLISKSNYLLDPYFSSLQNEARSKVAHNGWIGDHNPLVDFAEEKDFSFLRRQVNIWGDSIKLRYGDCPASSPFLWAHMGTYVAQMASAFDGFRLDNAHSTPIHVCQYMLQVARSHNPNLLVMAELFTSSAELDALFTTRLNINGMIREIMNKGDVNSVGAYFHEITCREAVLGKLDQEFEHVHDPAENGSAKMFRLLTPMKPSDVIYDCTHDNPSPLEKFGSRRLALPTIGLLGLADQIIASTWGYDQLLPENLSIVTEQRLYPIESSPSEAWGESAARPQIRPQAIEYVFRYTSSHSCQSVGIAGEFNSWQPGSLQMHRMPNSNNWQGSMLVDQSFQGKKVQFKFVEDGANWCVCHTLQKLDDGHGNENNYFELGDSRRAFDRQHEVKKMPDVRVARMLLNRAHRECTEHEAGIFMHSQTDDTIVVVRQLPLAHNDDYDAYVTVSRFPFSGSNDASISTTVELPGFLSEIVFAANIVDNYQIPARSSASTSPTWPPKEPLRPSTQVIDVPKSEVYMHNSLQAFAKVIDGAAGSRLEFFNLPQGFTCLLKTRCQEHMKQAVKRLDTVWNKSGHQLAKEISPGSKLSLTEINHVLYRCIDEEKDISANERGPYGLPERGQFVYSGLQGPMHFLQQLKISGDMGDALLDNIRSGDWLMEYSQARLESQIAQMPRLQGISDFIRGAFADAKKLPSHFKPKYVCRIIEKVFNAVLSMFTDIQMDPQVAFQKTPDPFLQQMVLACAQMYASVPSATFGQQTNTMCAGLPHFSTGYMRCWGRDTFISLRGLLLTTGLFKEAKSTILYFARVERHGLIPNLHDSGNNTRFNARDATWFFLQAIKDYIEMADDGLSILAERFEAEFESRWVMTIEELIIKILQAHATGINFREFNAGPSIDDQMKENGFNVKVEADLAQTGFCFGGNVDNCGTWMDKMGSAAQINKGVPATPRDGAPVELVGLQYSVLSFLARLHSQGKFSREGVDQISFQTWADLIKANFTRCFYVPEETSSDYDIDARFVNQRGIYKDTYRSTQGYTDYQLRPNLCIAMAVAPEIFDKEQARKCLAIVERVLMTEGAMGIKTLDPSDREYKGDYDNDDETRGHNYHQGPEWVWPVGYFLISKLNFCAYENQREAAQDIVRHLLPHQKHMLQVDPWHSLPELTNSEGKLCNHSCPAQAWSIATLLDALHQLGKFTGN